MELGMRIKELRKERKMSQEELAEMLNVSTGAVCKWESGSSCPDLSNLVLLAQIFCVSIDYLLECHLVLENEDRIHNDLMELAHKRLFKYSVSEVEKFESKYPNSYKVAYAITFYLYTLGFEQQDSSAISACVEVGRRAYELSGLSKQKGCSKRQLEYWIITATLRKGDPAAVVDFIKENEIEDEDLILGTSYERLNKNDLALECLSRNYFNSLDTLCDGTAYEAQLLNKIGKKADALEIVDWSLNLLTPIIKDKNSVLSGVKTVFLAIKVGILFPNEAYKGALAEALKIALGYKKNVQMNATNTKFFYGSTDVVAAFTNDLVYEIRRTVYQMISKDSRVEFDIEMNRQIELLK